MSNVFDRRDFLWKMVERDLTAFLKGGPDMELANRGRMLSLRDPSEVQKVQNCWADARRIRSQREQQREGA
jgi:hypothetical protein